ncbi:cyclase family protein [Clostridioides sp. ES-S-0005-03]|uniref:cyclase family protein n=1 Tax=Clostridioides sp. ES-S-0005-03 TaxID=2770774 RepID=UPI001D0FE060|nr:cyclase family protein [Clostridioides sp. ES-S-0005-03]UDN45870.1 cyclase family protein [Clostridioides sp. ES-S-0173-01]
MKVFDLTHVTHNDMPVYAETNRPDIKKVAIIEENGYQETLISVFSHNGTHMDSPKHMYTKGESLDTLDIENFVGKAYVLELEQGSKNIELEYLKKYEDEIKSSEFIIFKSGWSKFWDKKQYYVGYPTLTEEAANYIADSNLKGIGIDMLSVDRYNTSAFKVHHILFEKGKIIIENLTNLEAVPERFLFIAAPFKYNDADGAPVRAIAIVE